MSNPLVPALLTTSPNSPTTINLSLRVPRGGTGPYTVNVVRSTTPPSGVFNPLSFGGSLVRWLRSTGTLTDGAALFDGSTTPNKQLSIPSNTGLQAGAGSFEIAGWFTQSQGGGQQNLVFKGVPLSNAATEYAVLINSSGNVVFNVGSGTTNGTVVSGSAPVLGVKHFFNCWYDSAAKTINIQIDRGPIQSASWTAGVQSGTAVVTLGGGTYYGSLANLVFFKRLLLDSERSTLMQPTGLSPLGLNPGILAGPTGNLPAYTASVPSTYSSGSTYSLQFAKTNPVQKVALPSVAMSGTTWSTDGWFYSTGADSGGSCIISSGGSGVYVLNTTTIQTYFAGASHNWTVPTLFNGWHYYALVVNAGTATLYVDGTSIGSITITMVPTWTAIGADNTTTDCFKGNLFRIGVYNNHAMTAAEVTAVFTNGAGQPTPTSLWMLNEGPGATIAIDSEPANYYVGNGIDYASLPTAIQTESTSTFVSFWPLNQQPGSVRNDRRSSANHLIDTNWNVGLAAGPVTIYAPSYVGETISQMTDQGWLGNHGVSLANAAIRPTYLPTGLWNSYNRPAIRFEAKNAFNVIGQALKFLGAPHSGPSTIFILAKLRYGPDSGKFVSIMTIANSGVFGEITLQNINGMQPITILDDFQAATAGAGIATPLSTLSPHAITWTYDGTQGLAHYGLSQDGASATLSASGNLSRTSTDIPGIGARIDQNGNLADAVTLDVFEVAELNYAAGAQEQALMQGYFNSLGVSPSAAPAAPTVTPTGSYQRNILEWTAVQWADSYSIERSPHGANDFAPVSTQQVALTYVDSPVSNGTTYDYRVRSYSTTLGYGPYSAVVSIQPFTWDQAAGSLFGAWQSSGAYQDSGLTTPATAGSTVQGIKDLTGNSHNISLLLANQGTLSSTAELNGLSSVVCNPATPTWGTISGGTALNDFTVWMVAAWPTIDSNQKAWVGDGTNFFGSVSADTVGVLTANNTGGQTLPVTTAPVLIESRRNGTNWTVIYNGQTSLGTATVATTAITPQYFASYSDHSAPARVLNARWQALVIAPSDLSATNPTLYRTINCYLRDLCQTPGLTSNYVIAPQSLGGGWNANTALEQLDDGSLLAAWNNQVNSGQWQPVYLYTSRSFDGGKTWTTPTVAYQNPDWQWIVPSSALRQLADGTVIWPVILGNLAGAQRNYVMRSHDRGVTWSDPIPMGFDPASAFSLAQLYGQAIELTPGALIIIPFYGQAIGTTWWDAYLAQSTDNGYTWTVRSNITNQGSGTSQRSETDVVVTTGSNMIAVSRSDVGPNGNTGGTLYQTNSTDLGLTWGTPAQIFVADNLSASPRLLKLASGSIVVVYANRQSPSTIRVRRSTNGGTTWNAPFDLYTNLAAVSSDIGYMGLVELANGTVVVIWYSGFNINAGPARMIILGSFVESQLP